VFSYRSNSDFDSSSLAGKEDWMLLLGFELGISASACIEEALQTEDSVIVFGSGGSVEDSSCFATEACLMLVI